MGIVIVFLLAVLFVAAVWGRDAAQKLFKKGLVIGAAFVGFVAVVVVAFAVTLKAPDHADIDRSLAASRNSAYHAPLGPPTDSPGDALLRTTASASAPSYAGDGTPKIGINLEPLSPGNGALYQLPSGYGVFVSFVFRGSTAEAAGIRAGDFISAVDGKWITDASAINRNNVGKHVGDTIVLRVLRGGQQYDVRLPLGQP